ncbi:hypothetical protein MASR2M66_14230 [Chloroflexota bacterium]
MVKSKRKNAKKSEVPNILDKLVEQSLTLILSFIFSTALIGSCGYLLFQFSGEINSLDRELLEYDVQASQSKSFNDMLDVMLTGSIADETEKSQFSDIIEEITNDVSAKKLDPAFVSESLDWIATALKRLSEEQGQVMGYQVFGEAEKNLQNNFVAQYDYWINYIKETDSIIRYWDKDSPEERDKKLESLQYQLLDSLTNMSETRINLAQLREQSELDKKFLEQNTKELLTKYRILWIKSSLAGTGIIIGLAIFFYLGKSAVKKYGSAIK